jgi:hypothetical protein
MKSLYHQGLSQNTFLKSSSKSSSFGRILLVEGRDGGRDDRWQFELKIIRHIIPDPGVFEEPWKGHS